MAKRKKVKTAVIKKMRLLAKQGHSYKEIAEHLNAAGETRPMGVPWTDKQVSRHLVLSGLRRQNRVKQKERHVFKAPTTGSFQANTGVLTSGTSDDHTQYEVILREADKPTEGQKELLQKEILDTVKLVLSTELPGWKKLQIIEMVAR